MTGLATYRPFPALIIARCLIKHNVNQEDPPDIGKCQMSIMGWKRSGSFLPKPYLT